MIHSIDSYQINHAQHSFFHSHMILLFLLSSSELINIVNFDFQKAFNTVNHNMTLQKLKLQFRMNGMMLKLIKNYLKDRTQRLLVSRKLSALLKVKSGVPQGSILGPLLFINGMQTKISEHKQIALYADDTNLWRRIKSHADHFILHSDINALCEWVTINEMEFHPDKCKILLVNNFHKNSLQELPFYYFPYELDNVILDYTDEEKDLGYPDKMPKYKMLQDKMPQDKMPLDKMPQCRW